jgi:hypothetical protein
VVVDLDVKVNVNENAPLSPRIRRMVALYARISLGARSAWRDHERVTDVDNVTVTERILRTTRAR